MLQLAIRGQQDTKTILAGPTRTPSLSYRSSLNEHQDHGTEGTKRRVESPLIISMLQRFWNRLITADVPWDCDGNNDGQDDTRWEEALLQLVPSSQKYSAHNGDDEIPPLHVKQTESWDCGIACLMMAMHWLHCKIENVEEERMRMFKFVGTQSVWSIDLVHLLETYAKRSSSFTYLFCSKTLQVDQAHSQLSFYQKAFHSDQIRVTRLFERAHNQGWNLLQLDLTLMQVLELVRRPDCIAIALVDHATLLQRMHITQYSGHFIVLSGIRNEDGLLQVHNPTSMNGTDFISPCLFEKAWKAKGTDSDIIFLVKP